MLDAAGRALAHKSDPSNWTRERLKRQIKEFEGNLDAEHEVGMCLAMGPTGHAFHLENIGSWGPDMIILDGRDPEGKPVQLLQHYTQVSLLLTALPRVHEPARRIGFDLDVRRPSEREP
jgi:hypothetical protein